MPPFRSACVWLRCATTLNSTGRPGI